MWTSGAARGVGSGVTMSRAEILSDAAPFFGRREGRPLRTREIVTTSLTSPDSPVPDEGGGVRNPSPTHPAAHTAVTFLRNATLCCGEISSKFNTEMLEADVLLTLWQMDEVLRCSHLRDDLKKMVDEELRPHHLPPPTGGGLFHLLGGRYDGLTLELALFMQCASAGQVDVMRAILRRGNIDINARNVKGVVYKMGNLYTDGELVHHAGNVYTDGELVHRLVHH